MRMKQGIWSKAVKIQIATITFVDAWRSKCLSAAHAGVLEDIYFPA